MPWRRAIYLSRLVCRSSSEVTPTKWISRRSILSNRGSHEVEGPAPDGAGGGGCTRRWSAGCRRRSGARAGGCSRGGISGGRGRP
ncbi:unnamed protein product [Linum trigynum]|uniref:Uncharacterized protein n=1 Tax=Linum trigynum TaxID=586398 RepID=A0AAV2E048_9ROSI